MRYKRYKNKECRNSRNYKKINWREEVHYERTARQIFTIYTRKERKGKRVIYLVHISFRARIIEENATSDLIYRI